MLAYLAEPGRARYKRVAELLSAAEAELAASLSDDGELSRWLSRLTDIPTATAPDARN